MASITQRTGLLGYDNAAHLLRRATYKPTKALINTYASKTADQAVKDLFLFTTPNPVSPKDDTGNFYIPTNASPTVSGAIPSAGGNDRRHLYWWLSQAMEATTLQYRLVTFLHGIFINDMLSVPYYTYFDHLELFRLHADASIKTLAYRITTDISMLYYLNNRDNIAASPNQNYAREFLELFTILKGPQIGPGDYTTYTETDVQQAARVLTGFRGDTGSTRSSRLSTVDSVTKLPKGFADISRHDTGSKTFSAAFGGVTISGGTTTAGMEKELSDFMDMVFGQVETAKAYARRLYRFFVSRNITTEIESDIITPVANTLITNNYDLKKAVMQLLSSVHFFDEDDSTKGDEIIGALTKSPLDLALQMFNQLEISLPNFNSNPKAAENFYRLRIHNEIINSGYPLFQPAAVVGYAPNTESPNYDKLWITANNLRNRYALFLNPVTTGYTYNGFLIKFDIVTFVRYSGHFSAPNNATTLLQEFFDLLFTSTPVGNRYTYFLQLLLGGLSAINWKNDWDNYISTSNPTTVAIALNRLIKGLINSSEYQVF